MKLAALGAGTAVVGVALAIPGLLGIGLWWMLIGPVMRRYGTRLSELQKAAPKGSPPIDGRTFAHGTLLWALLAVPSLLVGILEIGIPSQESDWRWLPIAVGAFAAFIGVVGGGLYLLGSAVEAVADQVGVPEAPANVWIRAVRETGTFVNERPRLEFDLAVEPDASTGLAAYTATKKATVPFTAIGAVRVGDGFRALVVGPEEPTTMEIRWDEPLAAPETADGGGVAARLDALEQLRTSGTVTEEEYREQRERILGTL